MKNRTQSCLCTCGEKFPRMEGQRCLSCLRCETSARLKTAGIVPWDQGLVTIAGWNTGAQRRAGLA